MASTSSSSSAAGAAGKSRAYARKAAAKDVEDAKAAMGEWCTSEGENVQIVQAARFSLSEVESLGRVDALVEHLQLVRRLTKRPALTPEEISLIRRSSSLIDTLIQIALNPLTVDLLACKGAQAISEAEMEIDGRAEFYVRQFPFADQAALSTFLDTVLQAKSQYTYIAARIKAEMKKLPAGSKVVLGYGGYTVATDAAGRCEDDAIAIEMSFVQMVLEKFEGSPLIYTFPALEFAVESDIASRVDARTSLFESLVVDSFGFVCANTALPGQLLQLVVPEAHQSILSSIKSLTFGPDFLDAFQPKPAKASKSGPAQAASKSAADRNTDKAGKKTSKKEKDKAASSDGKGKGKAKAEKEEGKGKGKEKAKSKAGLLSPPPLKRGAPLSPSSPSKRVRRQ